MIDYVEDKVAADATHAVNVVAKGISSPDATLTTPLPSLILPIKSPLHL